MPEKILRHSREGRGLYYPTFPRRRESTIPAHAGIHRPITPMPEKILRHSRETPSFPQGSILSVIPAKAGIHNSRARGNSSSHYPNARKNTPSFPRRQGSILSVIPAKAGIHNSRARGNSSSHYPNARKNTPSFPRRQGSILSVIPAKAGIHNSRARGNSSSHYPNARKNTPSFPRRQEIYTIRHSREGGNPQFPRTREFIVPLPQCPKKHSVIPAKRGNPYYSSFHNSRVRGNSSSHYPNARKNTPSFPRRQGSILFVIPAKAGIHNSRARGNSSSHYPNARKNTPSFPRRRKSILFVIPAKAGIHNSRVRGNSSSHYPNARKKFPRTRPITPMPVIPAKAGVYTIRHSREGGNPQFPRTREFIVPLPQYLKKYSVIPAKAGMTMGWIPAFAGMTDDGVDSRLRGNGGVFLSGIRGKESRAGMPCSCGNINTAVFFPGISWYKQ